jgi:hypothetical protein
LQLLTRGRRMWSFLKKKRNYTILSIFNNTFMRFSRDVKVALVSLVFIVGILRLDTVTTLEESSSSFGGRLGNSVECYFGTSACVSSTLATEEGTSSVGGSADDGVVVTTEITYGTSDNSSNRTTGSAGSTRVPSSKIGVGTGNGKASFTAGASTRSKNTSDVSSSVAAKTAAIVASAKAEAKNQNLDLTTDNLNYGNFGGYVQPATYFAPTPNYNANLVGISTIGYLHGTVIEGSTINGGTATGLILNNAVFNGVTSFGSGVITGNATVNTITASTNANLAYISGQTQCLHVDAFGNITGTPDLTVPEQGLFLQQHHLLQQRHLLFL